MKHKKFFICLGLICIVAVSVITGMLLSRSNKSNQYTTPQAPTQVYAPSITPSEPSYKPQGNIKVGTWGFTPTTVTDKFHSFLDYYDISSTVTIFNNGDSRNTIQAASFYVKLQQGSAYGYVNDLNIDGQNAVTIESHQSLTVKLNFKLRTSDYTSGTKVSFYYINTLFGAYTR